MKEIRSKIIAIAAIACFAVSAASCDSVKPDSPNTETVVVTDEAKADGNESSDDESDNSADDSAVSEAPVPEVDDDGSKVSVVEVTDAKGEAVTDKAGKPVTELAVLDKQGTVITDSKGANVKPNIKVTTPAERIVENKETQKIPSPSAPEVTNQYTPKYVAEGPTVSLPDIEAGAGETVTFKVNVTGNSGYTALLAWIDINNKYFEFVSYKGGDTDDTNNKKSKPGRNTEFNVFNKKDAKDTDTLLCTYFDTSCESLTGDVTYATVTLKVKDETPAGKYDLAFDADGDGNGAAMCNNIVDKQVIVPTVTYKNGSITVK